MDSPPPDNATFCLLVSEQWQQKVLLPHIDRATRWVSPNLAAAVQLQEVIQQMVQIHDKSKHRREKRFFTFSIVVTFLKPF